MLVCFFECIMLKVFRERKVFFLSILSSFILVLIDQITKNIAFISVNDLLQKTNGIHGHFSIFPFLNIVLIFNDVKVKRYFAPNLMNQNLLYISFLGCVVR